MIKSLSSLLDKDWARLNELAGTPQKQRNLLNTFSYRFAPVTILRLAHHLHSAGWINFAKLPAFVNFVLFGIEVPPRLHIGPGLVLTHTQGTVLGAASIGKNVTIYQQVTLGAKDMDFAYTCSLRPVVEDGVIVSSGSKVLGNIVLGQGCVVGANAVVLSSVPPGYKAVGIPARNLPPKKG